MKNKTIYSLTIIVLFFLSSCSNNLSRGKAEDLIRESVYAKYRVLLIFSGDICAISENSLSPSQKVQNLEDNGYVKIKKYPYNEGFFKILDKGNEFFVETRGYKKSGYFEFGDIKSINITGIQIEDKSNCYVNVEITYKLNSIGEIYYQSSEWVIKRSLLFSLFDDGWRMNDILPW